LLQSRYAAGFAKIDEIVKSHQMDGTVKSSRFPALGGIFASLRQARDRPASRSSARRAGRREAISNRHFPFRETPRLVGGGVSTLRNEAYLLYVAMTKDEAQRRRWTFYEAVKIYWQETF
jgi:hypothetical protein